MFILLSLRRMKFRNIIISTVEDKYMKNFEWKRLIGIGLSVFALSVGSIGLTGCEAEPDGGAEELGEDIDDAADDASDNVNDAADDVEDEVDN